MTSSPTRKKPAGRALGAAAGLVADRLLGEPALPHRLHPVALFGSTAMALEQWLYAPSRQRGTLYTAAGAGLAVLAGKAVPSTALATYVSTSGRALHSAAAEIAAELQQGDLDKARQLLPNLVGRSPSQLAEAEIARAVVESVAENTTDAIVAPALWAAAAGAPGAFLHRAADTLDSMVGYRNDRYERFGTPAARLDDVLAWLPARATAGLVAAVRPHRAKDVLTTVRRDASAHPSPNAGVAEAAFAAALGLQLGGTNRYGDVVEDRPTLGGGRAPAAPDIAAAVALSRDVTWALAGALASLGLGLAVTARTGRLSARTAR